MWLLVNCKNGISSYEVARDLGVTQKTAWFMPHRIRYAAQTATFQKASGQVEVDETFIIGGKARHPGKLLVAFEAQASRYLCQRRALSSVPLLG
jgi:hypothetical protein